MFRKQGANVSETRVRKSQTGPTSFFYSSMELESAVRLKRNLTVIVFRGGYKRSPFSRSLSKGVLRATALGRRGD